ncbi:OBAP family protein [Pseudomonas sp. NPDC087342]|jgi:hypothetical protein|uniref:OBAP family protein n=1 Tax=unclassified Pseudomonas TaxID=196821 RepID=UPI0008E7E9BB|nr:OBAP family protein [Pseudomonas sp. OV546]SFU90817.1 Protein of unknown function [Pseudomonas sp. OV546]
MIRGNNQRKFFTALRPSLILTGLGLLTACAVNTTPSYVVAPGEEKTATTRALDTGAALLQSRPPIDELNAYLDGFHFYSGHPEAQMEAHHYCSILNEQVIQCVIYDGNRKDAKLMGVEYIIDEQLFAKLPNAEKALWHSHVHEVKSGQLIAPGIPDVAEHALMEKLIHTYGKTWHTWHTDLNKELPLGVPQLMMGFTADGQINQQLVTDRDKRFGVDSSRKKNARAAIPIPPIDPGADAWRNGKGFQIEDPTGNEHLH